MLSKLTMSLFFNISWAFPLFLWNTPQNEIKNGFYRFILGLSTILWGMASILLYFNITNMNDILFSFGLTISALLLIGGFTALIWNKSNISLFQVSTICGILSGVSYYLHKFIIVKSVACQFHQLVQNAIE